MDDLDLQDSLCSLLEDSAEEATGKNNLFKDGEYCIWGEVGRAVGIPTKFLKRMANFYEVARLVNDGNVPKAWADLTKPEQQVLGCDGYSEWDGGDGEEALKVACKAAAGMSIGQFTSILDRGGLLPKD